MTSRLLTSRLLTSTLLLTTITLIAAPALAEDECSADADCGMGYSCEEVGSYTCPKAPPCPDGEDDCETTSEPDCEEGVIMGCVAPPPQACDPSAADACSEGLTCLTYVYEECSGEAPVTCTTEPGGNETGCEEEEVEEPMCTTQSESYCVPEYFAPCQEDADCGGGFNCVDEEVPCATGCAEGESCESACEESSAQKYCELKEVACETDADCEAGLTCQEDQFAGSPDVYCEPGSVCPTPARQDSYCIPEDWDRWVDASNSSGDVDYASEVAESTGGGNDWKLSEKEESPQSLGADDEEPGGCQSTGAQQPAGPLGLIVAFGTLLMGLRRRR